MFLSCELSYSSVPARTLIREAIRIELFLSCTLDLETLFPQSLPASSTSSASYLPCLPPHQVPSDLFLTAHSLDPSF